MVYCCNQNVAMLVVVVVVIVCSTEVHTQAQEGDIRLVGGTSPGTGRVEIYHEQLWGTVCDDGWSYYDAIVTCRQLGFTGGATARCCALYGYGLDPIWLSNLACTTSEDLLFECGHRGWGSHYCGHYEDAGVVCEGPTNAVRLADGHGALEGRVEVFVNGHWGSVCADDWDIADANIVCQQLSYTDAEQIYNGTYFPPPLLPSGNRSLPVMGNVACSGTEEYLAECSHSGWGYINNCEQGTAGVKCRIVFGADKIRLVGGNSHEGRVEVLFDEEWGSICDDHWDINEGRVACRQLGFPGVLNVTRGASYGEGSGNIWLDDMACTGNELNLALCGHDGWGEIGRCTHAEDAGVVCLLTQDGDVRLVGGSNSSEGRVEIFHDQEWGSICDSGWDANDALVTCRHLGFKNFQGFRESGEFGVATGTIWLNNVRCNGNETSLSECGHDDWGDANTCSHNNDVGIVCSEASNKVRLVGGQSNLEGRVEIFHNGRWGTVCPDDWDVNEVRVMCRDLGFSGDGVVRNDFGGGRGPIWLGGLNCTGDEDSIVHCKHTGWEKNDCNFAFKAGVLCFVAKEGDVRLVNTHVLSTAIALEGRVELYHKGAWGTVCGRGWDIYDGRVICRQLGFSKAIQVVPDSGRYGPGTGDIFIADIDCTGSESSLLRCNFNGWGNNNCNHTYDAGVLCSNVDKTPPVIYNCPRDINITVEVGRRSDPVFWMEPWAADDTGVTTLLTSSHSPGYTFPVGVTIVTYLFINPANNIAACTFKINGIPVDTTPPVITQCPPDIYFPVKNGTSSVPVSWTEPSSFDLSNAVLQNNTASPGTEFPLGVTPVVYDFVDVFGNQAYCNFTINVFNGGLTQTNMPATSGNQLAIVNCPNDTVTDVEIGTPGTVVFWQNPWVDGVSGNTTVLVQTHTTGSIFPSGETTVTYIFTDDYRQLITCKFMVIGRTVDTTPPEVFQCPSNIHRVTELGISASTVSWLEPFAIDVSGNVTVEKTHWPGMAFQQGITSVKYLFIDSSDNMAECVFNVSVSQVDTTPPIVTRCPNHVSATKEFGEPSPSVLWNIPSARDLSGTVSVNSTHRPGSTFDVGTTSVVYMFEDSSQNIATCKIEVTVKEVDTRAPIIQDCPSDVNKTVELGIAGTPVFWTEPTATDASGDVKIILRSHKPGANFPNGTNVVTYLFADSAGNMATCVFTVIVQTVDTTPPMISQCPTDITTTSPRNGRLIWWTEPSAVDISGSVTRTVSGDQGGPGSGFPLGLTVVHYYFTDSSGNTANCSFEVFVQGLPTIPNSACPSTIRHTIELGESSIAITWDEPFVESEPDTERTSLLFKSHSPGTNFPVGRTEVSYVFADYSSNVASCKFAVIISTEDTSPPNIFQCPPDIERVATSHSTGTVVTWTEPYAIDPSNFTQVRSHKPGSVFHIGTTRVTYTFTDTEDNQAKCNFSITINPVETIFFEVTNCPADITDTVELGINNKSITWTEPIARDPHGRVTLKSQTHRPGDMFSAGENNVIYEFINEAGHVVDCEFKVLITLVDTSPPIINNCPRDIHTTMEIGSPGKSVAWSEPSATDLSGGVILLFKTHVPNSLFYPGVSAVTYIFSDASKNMATCTFQVNTRAVDTSPPLITSCPSHIYHTIETGTQTIPITWNEPEAIDISGDVPTKVNSHNPGDHFVIGTTSVSYEFRDNAHNLASCFFDVTIHEDSNYQLEISNCPRNMNATTTTSSNQLCQMDWIEPKPDDSSGNSRLFLKTHSPGAKIPEGTTLVTYIFNDEKRNFATCSFSVTCFITESVQQTQPDDVSWRLSIAGVAVAGGVAVCFLLIILLVCLRGRVRNIKHTTLKEDLDPGNGTYHVDTSTTSGQDDDNLNFKTSIDTQI